MRRLAVSATLNCKAANNQGGGAVYTTIIWATDGSDGADAALAEALRLADLSGGRVVAVHCDQRLNGRPGGWLGRPAGDRRLRIQRQVTRLRNEGVDIGLVIRRSHAEAAEVVAAIVAELEGDVVVCGTRGVGTLPGPFLGNFTQRLLELAPCPVLVVGGLGRSEAARGNCGEQEGTARASLAGAKA
jgi:nucleotide-binding universal stress UspA family protein